MIRNKVIKGLVGTGKSVKYVAPAIKNHKGRVIWINSQDDRQYLDLLNDVEVVSINDLSKLNDFEKIEINMNCILDALEEKDIEKLEAFIDKFINEKDVLIIFDEAYKTVGSIIPKIIKDMGRTLSSKMIIIHEMNQLEGQNFDIEKELMRCWEVVDLNQCC